MGGITLIEQGQTVPLSLALSDGATDQFPQAEVYDPDGNNLTTISLSHDGDGLYQPASGYSMPDENYISVVYIVYTDSGHLTESAIYQRAVDIFRQIDSDDFKADISTLATEVNASVNRVLIIAEIDENEVKIDQVLAAIALLNNISVADLLAGIIEGAITLQDVLKVALAALAGLADGAGSATQHFRDQANTLNRITADVDISGNRTNISLDLG